MGRTQVYVVVSLVRMKAEDHLTHAIHGSILDYAYAGVAILHRSRELTRLKGCTHTRIFCRRHVAVEDQGLRPSADSAVKCSYPELARAQRRQRFLLQL